MFKRIELSRRVELLERLIDIVDQHDLGRVAIRLDPTRIFRNDIEALAFMFLVERVEGLMKQLDSTALLIFDHDHQVVTPNVTSLSTFKAEGTDFEYGREIRRIVDTVHHTRSHHSRLIQLADVYAYGMSLLHKPDLTYPRSRIADHIRSKGNFAWPSKYKYWPSDG